MQLICPHCHNQFLDDDVNPKTDLAFCRHCNANYRYRELYAYCLQMQPPQDSLDVPSLSYQRLNEQVEVLKPKLTKIFIVCYLGAAIFAVFLASLKQPIERQIFDVCLIALLLVGPFLQKRKVVLDSAKRQLHFSSLLKRRRLSYDDIKQVEYAMNGDSESSYVVQFIPNDDGKELILCGGLTEREAIKICNFLTSRIFR